MIQIGFARMFCEVEGKQAFMFLEQDTSTSIVKEILSNFIAEVVETEKRAIENQKLQECTVTEDITEVEPCQELVS